MNLATTLQPTPIQTDHHPQFTLQRHNMALGMAILAIALSFALSIRPDGRVALGVMPRWVVPETCPVHAILHIDCPGCGLTRSCICLAHGHWQSSLRYHRLGWIMALAIVLQLPYRGLCLWYGACPGLPARDARWIGWLLAASLAINWLINLI